MLLKQEVGFIGIKMCLRGGCLKGDRRVLLDKGPWNRDDKYWGGIMFLDNIIKDYILLEITRG